MRKPSAGLLILPLIVLTALAPIHAAPLLHPRASEAIVRFSNRLYSALDGKNETELAHEFRNEFLDLQAEYDAHPLLAGALQNQFEMQPKASAEEIEQMMGVLDLLDIPDNS